MDRAQRIQLREERKQMVAEDVRVSKGESLKVRKEISDLKKENADLKKENAYLKNEVLELKEVSAVAALMKLKRRLDDLDK